MSATDKWVESSRICNTSERRVHTPARVTDAPRSSYDPSEGHVNTFQQEWDNPSQYPYPTESMFATIPFRNQMRRIRLLGPKL